MKRYRKKPVEIEAVQFLPCNYREIDEMKGIYRMQRGHGMEADVHTDEGVMRAKYGDYIIRGVEGEIYPCRASVFEATYEPV